MHLFAINYTPLMTSFLVHQTAIFRENPIVILDVGARGGIGPQWDVFGDQIRVYAFEPDEEECARLAATAPSYLTYIPKALGQARGRQTLYHAYNPASSGLYRTRMEYFDRLLNRENGVTVGESIVEVASLDEVLADYNVPPVDFIKLDVEGAELDVLKGGKKFLSGHSPLGLLSEIRFHEEINGSPPFAAFDTFLREHGLRLFDMQFHYQSRRALPYRGLGHNRRPDGKYYFSYTTQGQLLDGDALYFRDFLLPEDKPLIGQVPAVDILKLCAFLEIFSKNDCAAELLLASRDRIDALVDSTRLLDLLATGTNGSPTTFERYASRYFVDPPPVVAVPMSVSTLFRRGANKLRRMMGAS